MYVPKMKSSTIEKHFIINKVFSGVYIIDYSVLKQIRTTFLNSLMKYKVNLMYRL